MREQHYVVCKLPNAGLGNKLLVWAKAMVFAHINQLELWVSPWFQMKLKSLLRKEQSRFYLQQLRNEPIMRQLSRFYLLQRFEQVYNPALDLTIVQDFRSVCL